MLKRIVYGVLVLALIVLGLFFLTVALIAGGLLALIILARWWWLSRKLRRQRAEEILEGEYKVVERSELERRRSQPVNSKNEQPPGFRPSPE